jgi:hypothetical protein
MIDVTDKVCFGENDGEWLPLTKCVCGQECWLSLGIYEDMPTECPKCKRQFIFSFRIKVFELEKNERVDKNVKTRNHF